MKKRQECGQALELTGFPIPKVLRKPSELDLRINAPQCTGKQKVHDLILSSDRSHTCTLRKLMVLDLATTRSQAASGR